MSHFNILGPFVSFLISFRRYIGIKYPDMLLRNSKIVNIGNTISLLVVIAYYVSLGIFSTLYEFRTFNFVQLCLRQPEGESQSIMLFSVMVPNILLNCFTIAFDFATKVKINQDVVPMVLNSIMTERKRIDEIAKRAIYINVGLFVPWILYIGNYHTLTLDENRQKCLIWIFFSNYWQTN